MSDDLPRWFRVYLVVALLYSFGVVAAFFAGLVLHLAFGWF